MEFMKNGLKLVGAVPYGLDSRDGDLSPNPEEMGMVREVLRMRAKQVSYRGIADRLNRKGVPSKNGGKWYPKTVMGIFKHISALPRDHWVIKQYFPKGGRGKWKRKMRPRIWLGG